MRLEASGTSPGLFAFQIPSPLNCKARFTDRDQPNASLRRRVLTGSVIEPLRYARVLGRKFGSNPNAM